MATGIVTAKVAENRVFYRLFSKVFLPQLALFVTYIEMERLLSIVVCQSCLASACLA